MKVNFIKGLLFYTASIFKLYSAEFYAEPSSERMTWVEYIKVPIKDAPPETVFEPCDLEPFCYELKLRAAVYIPSNARFKEIYGNAGVTPEVELDWHFLKNVFGFANVNWLTRHGRAHGSENSTRVNVANISFGLNFRARLCGCLGGYLGVGPNISSIWVKEKCFCGTQKISRVCIGGVFKSGLQYDFSDRYFIEAYADYLLQPVRFEKKRTVSGLKIGGGFGFKF